VCCFSPSHLQDNTPKMDAVRSQRPHIPEDNCRYFHPSSTSLISQAECTWVRLSPWRQSLVFICSVNPFPFETIKFCCFYKTPATGPYPQLMIPACSLKTYVFGTHVKRSTVFPSHACVYQSVPFMFLRSKYYGHFQSPPCMLRAHPISPFLNWCS
jgi:hypothetical protein